MLTLKTFYKTKEWVNFRTIVISENQDAITGHNYCSHCHKEIVSKYDLIVHHVVELTDDNVNDYNISLNPNNVEIICSRCHNKEHRRFGNENNKKVFLVYGAPCSGKNTWVNNVAQPNDLIIDLDCIYESISINKKYTKPPSLKSVVFDIRDTLYDAIIYRRGKWSNAFVIGGYPDKGERDRVCQRLNAEEVFINSTKEECLERLVCANNRNVEEWSKYIVEWFDSYVP